MKAQLISLLMFAAPLMLQVLMSDRPASTESSSASSEPAVPASAPSAVPARPATPAPTATPAKTPCCAPATCAPATPAPTATKPGHRIPAKLAPWFM